jgi:hypothetical protein
MGVGMIGDKYASWGSSSGSRRSGGRRPYNDTSHESDGGGSSRGHEDVGDLGIERVKMMETR